MFKHFNTAAAKTPEFIAWKDYYSVGNEAMDDQHKTLLSLFNRLYDGIEKGTEKKLMQPVLEQLMEYAKVHFAQEEELMEACGFPDLPGHKQLHLDMAKKTREAWQASRSGGVSGKDVLYLLKEWWVDHVCGEDKK